MSDSTATATGATNLLLEIAHCPNVPLCLASRPGGHPCGEVVRSQNIQNLDNFQIPEPWSGDLTRAPILFLSSNPSISAIEDYPRWNWPDEHIEDYFVRRFGGGRKEWVRGGTKTLLVDGTYERATAFWAGVRQRAIEVLERDVRPGIDYALTEVVHCKSIKETGVAFATSECVRQYLERLLRLSAASVILVLGRSAGAALVSQLDIPDETVMYGPASFFGRQRILAFLPHPNAHQERTLSRCLDAEDVQWLREFAQFSVARRLAVCPR